MKSLDNSVSIFVPESKAFSNRADYFRDALVKAAGGYTATDVYGGWRSGDTIVEEEVIRFDVAFDGKDKDAVVAVILQFAIHLMQTGEEAVMVSTPAGAVIYYHSDIPRLVEALQ